ncbi:MAG TPA: efflux RND transporter permease subunit, partial [bacterium]|nr:efflux RND transporter permease subunit [bacterium]
AIVVRENIWRHIEGGEDPKKAAVSGALEVMLAVVATSSVVISVFFPIAFLKGTIGQFFREFGLSVCFAMAVSLFESLVMGPMLSAYLGKKGTKDPLGYWRQKVRASAWFNPWQAFHRVMFALTVVTTRFARFQDILEERYVRLIDWCLEHRLWVVLGAAGIFLASVIGLGPHIKSTFLPSADVGEFVVQLKAPPGTSLEAMRDETVKVDDLIRKHPEVVLVSDTIGGTDSTGVAQQDANTARIYVKLLHYDKRKKSTAQIKDEVRDELEPYQKALNPQVADQSGFGDMAPFNLNLIGQDYSVLVPLAEQVADKIRGIHGLADVQSTYDGGKPEFQAVLDPEKLRLF